MTPDTLDRELAVARAVLDAVPPATPAELAALRRATAERVRVPPRRRPRLLTRPLRLAVAVGAIAAAGFAIVALAPSDRGGGHAPAGLSLPGPAPASAAERLQRALTLAEVVVHYRMVGGGAAATPASTGGAADPAPATFSSTYERWETADGSLTLVDEGTGWVVERARAGDRVEIYSPTRNAIVSALGADVGTPQDGIPSLAEIVDGLRSGRITATEADLAGQAVLEVASPDGFAVTVFDAETYRPIEVRYGPDSAYRYVDYSAVPRTSESVAAVSLAARHPDARTVDDPALYSEVLGELYPNG